MRTPVGVLLPYGSLALDFRSVRLFALVEFVRICPQVINADASGGEFVDHSQRATDFHDVVLRNINRF
jgi:hypothetical protein